MIVGMEIGVIDTGVDLEHKRFINATISAVTILESKTGSQILKQDTTDKKGHGTGIVSIILKHVPTAKINVVKIDSETSRISEELVVSAIDYLINNSQSKIINISMGVKTNNPSSKLLQICQKAEKKGIIIVAASYYDSKELCYPAHFNSVISVGNGVVKQKKEFKWLERGITNVLAKGGFQRVAHPENQFRFSSGTSLATAHFTGIISCSFIKGFWQKKTDLLSWVRSNSEPSIFSLSKHDFVSKESEQTDRIDLKSLYKKLRPSDNLGNLAIFPFEEKEMKSLIEHSNYLSYPIGLAVGYPRTLKMSSLIKNLVDKNIRYTTNKLEDEEYMLFDTIVIGYFLDKQSDHNTHFGYHLLKSCLIKNKNIIVWDEAVKKLIETIIEDNEIDFSARIFLSIFDESIKNLLYSSVEISSPNVPSICVVGTNSRQGKFTTQMRLKEILEKRGEYNVAHLTTEPQGILLGADISFPLGHNGTIKIEHNDWGRTIRALTNLIEYISAPDIILTGSQGGILPLHPVDDLSVPEKLIFTKSFYPDALICTISPNDSLDRIKNTIRTLKSFLKANVLFYALTPWQYKFYHGNRSIVSFNQIERNDYLNKLLYFNKNLEKPVLDIKDSDNDSYILDLVKQYFQ